MKIDISRAALYDAVNTLKDVAGSEGIIRNILFRRDGDSLTLTATDVNRTMVKTIEAKFSSDTDIEFVLPAKFLAQILSVLHDTIVQIDTDFDVNRIKLNCGESRYKIPSDNAKLYPKLESVGESKEFSISQAALKTMFKSVSYAMAGVNTGRRALIGVNLKVNNGEIVTRATDGYRVAVANFSPEGIDKAIDASIVIPDSSMRYLQRIIGDNGTITVVMGKNMCKFQSDTWTFITNLVDAEYPALERVIPTNFKHTFTIDRGTTLDAIKQASVAMTSTMARVFMDFGDNSIVFSANGNEDSDASASVAIKYDGGHFRIGINPLFLTDMLSSVPHDEISLSIVEGTNQVCMRMNGLFAMVMPLSI